MNREDFVAVAARLFGVYLIVVGIQFVFSAIAANREQPDTVTLGMLLGLVAVLGLVILVLWVFPLTIARKLLPVMRDTSTGAPITGAMALSLGFTLLGIWLFAHAISDLVYWATIWARTRSIDDAGFVFAPAQVANIAASMVRFVMSLVLMLGATGLRNTLLRLRYGPEAGF